MNKEGILILECQEHSDPGSEGQFLLHMFNLMEIDSQYIEVRTKRQLLALLDKPPFRFVHITTHGSVSSPKTRKPKFAGLWAGDEDITKDDLETIRRKLTNRTVVTTACMSGAKDFAYDFADATNCKHYIAPKKSPTFSTAIFFSHLLYHKYFRLSSTYKKKMGKIVKSYKDKYKNVAQFEIYNGPKRNLRS